MRPHCVRRGRSSAGASTRSAERSLRHAGRRRGDVAVLAGPVDGRGGVGRRIEIVVEGGGEGAFEAGGADAVHHGRIRRTLWWRAAGGRGLSVSASSSPSLRSAASSGGVRRASSGAGVVHGAGSRRRGSRPGAPAPLRRRPCGARGPVLSAASSLAASPREASSDWALVEFGDADGCGGLPLASRRPARRLASASARASDVRRCVGFLFERLELGHGRIDGGGEFGLALRLRVSDRRAGRASRARGALGAADGVVTLDGFARGLQRSAGGCRARGGQGFAARRRVRLRGGRVGA